MYLPNFLIIGAQKAGTTWLASMLGQHPDIYVAPTEMHYFDKMQNFHRGLDWYASHFSSAGNASAIGEKTPDYLWTTMDGVEGHAAGSHIRILQTLPEARLIIILRNPVDRAISEVHHIMQSGRVSPRHTLDDLLVGNAAARLDGHGVLEQGRYASLIVPYLEIFPPDRIRISIFEEDIIGEPLKALVGMCDYLGVDSGFEFDPQAGHRNESRRSRAELFAHYYMKGVPTRPLRRFIRKFATPWKPQPSAETLRELARFYRSPNEELFELLGRRVPTWDAANDKRLV